MDEKRTACILKTSEPGTWCNKPRPEGEFSYENVWHALNGALQNAGPKICRVCAVKVTRTLLRATTPEPNPYANLVFGDGEDGVVQVERAPLPRIQYEADIIEVGSIPGMAGPLVRFPLGHGDRTTDIPATMAEAQAMAAHLYRRALITVDVLPRDAAPSSRDAMPSYEDVDSRGGGSGNR